MIDLHGGDLLDQIGGDAQNVNLIPSFELGREAQHGRTWTGKEMSNFAYFPFHNQTSILGFLFPLYRLSNARQGHYITRLFYKVQSFVCSIYPPD